MTLAKNSFLKNAFSQTIPLLGHREQESGTHLMRSECQERRREARLGLHLPPPLPPPCRNGARSRKTKRKSRAENGPGGGKTGPRKGTNGRQPGIVGAGSAPTHGFIALVSDSKLAVNPQQLHTHTHTQSEVINLQDAVTHNNNNKTCTAKGVNNILTRLETRRGSGCGGAEAARRE